LTRRACPTKCFGYGEVVDVYLEAKRDGTAAKRFLTRLVGDHRGESRKIFTGKLRSYRVAHREVLPEAIHSTKQYENNRTGQSCQANGLKKLTCQNPTSTPISSITMIDTDRNLRATAFQEWSRAVVRTKRPGVFRLKKSIFRHSTPGTL